MNSETVLILATSLNDAQIAVEILGGAGVDARSCRNEDELATGIRTGCGAVVLAEECLDPVAIAAIESALNEQETWSDLPIILLTTHESSPVSERFSRSGNTSLLERPFSKQTLIRSVQVALRARRKQYQVGALLDELIEAKNEAERANSTKTQFLANMSHEIRTPIGAIIGFTDLIKHPGLPADERARYTEVINRNSHQLLRLIDDILDLSKVEAGKISIEHVEFRLPDLLADLSSVMRFRAEEKGIEFKIALDSKIPDIICTDPVRLRQILANIVGNGIKFTEAGFVEMRVRYVRPNVTFDVSDSGVGLNPEQADTLFRPFVQADSSTTRKFGGTGLGLAIAKQLAKTMGGDVSLQKTTPGTGSTFRITIELNELAETKLVGDEALIIKPGQTRAPVSENALSGLKVLLVEDSSDNQMLITRFLTKAGASVISAYDGAEGFEKANRENFDVVLMDIQMPRMDGHEATKKLRETGYTGVILALTAHAMNEEKKKSFASGFTDFLTKPIQASTLVSVLKTIKPNV